MGKNNYIFLNGLIDLAQSRLGSKIVFKTNEFFAPAKRIINPWPPVSVSYTHLTLPTILLV